jgi:hypothetical protein
MDNQQPCFPYRAWSISSYSNWELLERTVDRALKEAPRHQVNCFEIHDYMAIPLTGWVDAAAQYRNYPKLAQAKQLTFPAQQRLGVGGSPRTGALTHEERLGYAQRLKSIARKVRDAGLELQVWYHCFRGWPEETFQFYPELRDAGGDGIYRFVADTLHDAFEFFPEITGLTVTSLRETPSILRFSGRTSQADRMHRLYSTLVVACEKHGRRLILRDFIDKKSEFDDFAATLDRLPDSVMIMTKNVVADWAAHEKPINPFIFRYAAGRKRLVVEYELANNYTGEIDFPWCDPEQLWRQIHLLASLKVHGAVGRLVNSDHVTPGTIFDSPNEVNVWAFSRCLVSPGRLLEKPEDSWWHDCDNFDMTIWTDWAKERFGGQAASEVVHILQQTPRMVALTLNLCGEFFALAWWMMRSREMNDSHVRSALRALRRCGAEHARAEKAEAAAIVEEAIIRIERLCDLMTPEAYKNIRDAFERARHVVAIYRAICESFLTAVEVDEGKADREALPVAAEQQRAACRAAIVAYSEHLYDSTPKVAMALAEYFEQLPGRIDSIMGNPDLPGA